MGEEPVICVVGLGYVGLPTAIAFYDAGYRVHGIDIEDFVITSIKAQRNHLRDSVFEMEIPEQGKRWHVSSDFELGVGESDVILITVPTPVNADKTPNLDIVRSAMRSVLLSAGEESHKTVVLESTVYPGATMEIVQSLKNELGSSFPSGVKYGYSPERVSPGDQGKDAHNVAKIVGANDEKTGFYLSNMYSKITNMGCDFVGAIEVAEAAKMVENTQRDIDIAFVNELAKTLPNMGLDVIEVLKAASTKWNFHNHNPGIGVGGHCIPVDPYYYIQSSIKSGLGSMISPCAREINESMPSHVASMICNELDVGENVLILGLAYKAKVGDTRETPVIELVKELLKRGVESSIWDPLVGEVSLPKGSKIVIDPYQAASEVGMIVLATAHPECLDLDWEEMSRMSDVRKIYDGPRALDRKYLSGIGFEYFGVGLPYEKIS